MLLGVACSKLISWQEIFALQASNNIQNAVKRTNTKLHSPYLGIKTASRIRSKCLKSIMQLKGNMKSIQIGDRLPYLAVIYLSKDSKKVENTTGMKNLENHFTLLSLALRSL